MNAENIFLYMTLTGLLLIPVALWMTDFSAPIEYGWAGPGLAAITQILNAVGALTLVYAFRYGRAIVVAPLANAGAPLITAIVSMLVLGVMPNSDHRRRRRPGLHCGDAARHRTGREAGQRSSRMKALLDLHSTS